MCDNNRQLRREIVYLSETRNDKFYLDNKHEPSGLGI